MFRFCHYIVNILKKLDFIKIVFPIRGHSYLDCGRNISLINQKFPAETPQDWVSEIKSCRTKPSPFDVIEADLTLFRQWTQFLEGF